MPRFAAQDLREMTGAIFRAVGFPPAEAATIARLLIEANLCGHDSHGFRNVPVYLRRVGEGTIVPGAKVTIVRETPATAILEGNRTLGFVGASRAVELGLAKARKMKVSAVGVRGVDHVGRIGAYPAMIAAEGMIGLCYVNAQGRGRLVAPFGGVERRIGTNPVAAAFPNPPGAPILVDFATSTVAANKIGLAAQRGVETGEGWIVDREGRPTRDPAIFLEALGMLLPFGAGHGYKGYGLAVMVDILGGVLAGSGTAAAERDKLDNGTFLITIDPEAFVAKADYERQVAALAAYLRETPTRPGDEPVMMPGELEERYRKEREAGGIVIEPEIWQEVAARARELNVNVPAAAE